MRFRIEFLQISNKYDNVEPAQKRLESLILLVRVFRRVPRGCRDDSDIVRHSGGTRR
jgi:hypothetical protein